MERGRRMHVRVWSSCLAVMTLAALIAGSAPARAQGFYYKEITRDGRIYVFNIAAEAERFEKTGEMGRGLTRPGVGPNGETVVGDTERALQLFFFKHGISEVVAEAPAPDPADRVARRQDAHHDRTSPTWRSPTASRCATPTSCRMSSRRFSPGTANAGDSRGSFRIRRAKFKLEGWFWRPPDVAPAPAIMPRLSYEMQLNWPDVTAANAPGNMLEDANIAWDPQGKGKFRVVFGQFKVPFGRQEMTSSGNQQFVDRSLVSNEYARGRETGVAVQGAVWSNKLEYRAGVFNGNGRTQDDERQRLDADQRAAHVAAERQPGAGPARLGQRRALLGVGLRIDDRADLRARGRTSSTTTSIARRPTPASNFKSNVVGIDGIYKYKGFSTTGEYYLRKRDAGDRRPKFDANGGYIQVGQMLNQFRTWEAAFRYGQREVSDLVADDTHQGDSRGAQLLLPPAHAEVPDRLRPDRESRAVRAVRPQGPRGPGADAVHFLDSWTRDAVAGSVEARQ